MSHHGDVGRASCLAAWLGFDGWALTLRIDQNSCS